jgi:hypothetical protein
MDIFATIGFTVAAAIGLLLFFMAALRRKK